MRYTFGDYSLDVEACRLLRGDEAIALQPKVFDALVYLVERRERVVTKDELLGALWPPNISESVLPRCMSALRKALDDEGGAIITTVWGRGYRFVADVIARRAVSTAPRAQQAASAVASHTTPSGRVFVGRDDVVATLEATLDHAIAGRGRTIVLSGPSGSGKSRTAGMAIRAAIKRQAATIAVACDTRDASPRHWPWLQIARRALKLAPAPEPHDDVLDALADDGQDVREAMMALLRASADEGLLILLDDIHLTDEASLHTLEHVSAEIANSKIMLLVTLRDDGIAARDPLALTLAALTRRASSCQHIRLPGLRLEEVERFVAHVRRAETPPGVAERVHALTSGNPLYVEEVVAALSAQDWDERALAEPPLGIRAAVGRRLEALSDDAGALLQAAAAGSGEESLVDLARALGLAHERAMAALDEAAAAGLVQPFDPPHPIRFTPPIIGAALYEDLDHSSRRALHGTLAAVLQSPSARAHHLLRTGRPDDRREALTLKVEAAEQADHEPAFRQALEWLGDEEASLQVRALIGLARLEGRAGGREAARTTLRRAAALARRRDDPGLLGGVAIAMNEPFEPSPHEDAEALALLREALEQAHDDATRDLLNALLASPRRGDDSVTGLRVAYHAGAIPDGQETHADIVNRLNAAAARSRRIDDRAHALFVAFGASLAADELAAAREAATALALLPGDAFHRWRASWATAACSLADGHPALPELDEQAHAFAPCVALALRTRAAQLSADWSAVEQHARELARHSSWAKPIASAWLALSRAHRGEIDGVMLPMTGGVHDLACAAIAADTFEVRRAEGDIDCALRIAETLIPFAERAASHDVLRIYFGPVSLTLARLLRCAADQRADAYLEMATRAARRGVSPWVEEQVRMLTPVHPAPQ